MPAQTVSLGSVHYSPDIRVGSAGAARVSMPRAIASALFASICDGTFAQTQSQTVPPPLVSV